VGFEGFVGLGCFRVLFGSLSGVFLFFGYWFLVGFAWVGVETIVSCILRVC
jgi:hypothetical protein